MSLAKLAEWGDKTAPTVIAVGEIKIGGSYPPVIIAGPCSIEDRNSALELAVSLKSAGAQLFRGGIFKPRTSPYSFQGLKESGLSILAEIRRETGMPVVSEVLAPEQVQVASDYVDILQVGSRNMQNFPLLQAVGRANKPVLLKRGLAATLDEWLCAAEYILTEGNMQVILCERGIRTFEPSTRNTLDISAVPLVKLRSHLPIIVDPSHASGRADLITPLSKAALAVGSDGLMVEVHQNPREALSDGEQSITVDHFQELVRVLRGM